MSTKVNENALLIALSYPVSPYFSFSAPKRNGTVLVHKKTKFDISTGQLI